MPEFVSRRNNELYVNLNNLKDAKFADLKRRCRDYINQQLENSPDTSINYDLVIRNFLVLEALNYAVIKTTLNTDKSLENLEVHFLGISDNNNRQRHARKMIVEVVTFIIKAVAHTAFEFGFVHPFMEWVDYNTLNEPHANHHDIFYNVFAGRGAAMWTLIGVGFSAFAASKAVQSMYFDPYNEKIDTHNEHLRRMINNHERLLRLMHEYNESGSKDILLQLESIKQQNQTGLDESKLSESEFSGTLCKLKSAIEPMLQTEYTAFIEFCSLLTVDSKDNQQFMGALINVLRTTDITEHDLNKLYQDTKCVPSLHERIGTGVNRRVDAFTLRLEGYDEIHDYHYMHDNDPRITLKQLQQRAIEYQEKNGFCPEDNAFFAQEQERLEYQCTTYLQQRAFREKQFLIENKNRLFSPKAEHKNDKSEFSKIFYNGSGEPFHFDKNGTKYYAQYGNQEFYDKSGQMFRFDKQGTRKFYDYDANGKQTFYDVFYGRNGQSFRYYHNTKKCYGGFHNNQEFYDDHNHPFRFDKNGDWTYSNQGGNHSYHNKDGFLSMDL